MHASKTPLNYWALAVKPLSGTTDNEDMILIAALFAGQILIFGTPIVKRSQGRRYTCRIPTVTGDRVTTIEKWKHFC
jgi:hypothetical protein